MSRRFLLRLLAAAPPSEHVSDAELLRRFVKERDCAALELLVRRHADAVWAACRRVCRCEADAEDAFQASFLALLKSASSVRGSCAGGWLHRVAVNASLKLRAARATSMETAALDALPAKTDERDSEVASAVHEELARLSETERLPVVLCDLEGLTHSAAADALGWPVGTVAGRLSRARAKLRARLARRGFAPCAVPALVAPPALVSSAVSLSAGAPPHAVALLAEGVLSAMHSAKLKLAACAALVCAAVGTALALAPGAAEPRALRQEPKRDTKPDKYLTEPPSAFPEVGPSEAAIKSGEFGKLWKENAERYCPRVLATNPITISPDDDQLRKHLKARLYQGCAQVRRMIAADLVGAERPTSADRIACLLDMEEVAKELWANDARELVLWLEDLVVLGKHYERYTRIRVEFGSESPSALHAATRYRLRAETELMRAKKRK
jgi:RNA polymerase sigma factor (sigma-70 family)